ncbi:MAG: hypothetical protein OFPI_09620 [Osedax symbiont Rs2]|nr:MAG: hypothetical protein OFPI_09620 [Osedax symbiont Rs2]
MTHFIEKIELKTATPGVRRFLKVHRFKSKKPGPKVYLHAGLHADEWPGLLTLQHLITRLISLDEQELLAGEIVIVPFANPIGMDQRLNGSVIGRYSFSGEGNFNRNWPDLTPAAQACLLKNPKASVEDVRQALREAVAELPTHTPLCHLRAILLSLSIDADIILDLHCDSQALLHIYGHHLQSEQSELLAKHLACPIVLLEDEVGASPFDASHVTPWLALAKYSIPLSCFSVTIELRGFADVNDHLAAQDAEGILSFLASNAITTAEITQQPPVKTRVTRLEGVDTISAAVCGIICWKIALGDQVDKGQLIAEIADIEADNPLEGRTPIYSKTQGVLFTTTLARLVTTGEIIAKIAGPEPLENTHGGSLLML